MIDALRQGYYEPSVGMYASDSPWYAETDYPDPDAERAAELVAEWEAENGPLTIRLGGTTSTDTNEMLVPPEFPTKSVSWSMFKASPHGSAATRT